MKRLFDEQGVRLLGLAIGALIAAQGVWAFVAPRSFFDTLATFDPYNAHFIRDIGTIQVGVGVAGVVGASRRATGVVAGLAGLAAFQVLHVVSHAVDHDKGGRPGFDIPALSSLALLTTAALVAAVRQARARD
jgi:hypothetical protein